MVWNFTGAMELGGKYMSLPRLCYSVGSIIPGLMVGIHGIKLYQADSEEERAKLLHKSCIYTVISWIYIGAFALVFALLPFSGYIASFTD